MFASSTFKKDIPPNIDDDGARHEAKLQLEERLHNPIAFHAKTMEDIM